MPSAQAAINSLKAQLAERNDAVGKLEVTIRQMQQKIAVLEDHSKTVASLRRAPAGVSEDHSPCPVLEQRVEEAKARDKRIMEMEVELAKVHAENRRLKAQVHENNKKVQTLTNERDMLDQRLKILERPAFLQEHNMGFSNFAVDMMYPSDPSLAFKGTQGWDSGTTDLAQTSPNVAAAAPSPRTDEARKNSLATKSHAKRFGAMLSIFNAVSRETELGRAVSGICSEACQLVGAMSASVFVLDAYKRDLYQVDSHGEARPHRTPLGRGVVGYVAEVRRSLNIWDVQGEPRCEGTTSAGTHSLLVHPITDHDDMLVGVIQVSNKKHGKFSREDEVMLGIMMTQAGISLRNALNFHQLSVQLRRLKSFSQAVLELYADATVAGVMRAVNDRAQTLFGAERCLLLLIHHPRLPSFLPLRSDAASPPNPYLSRKNSLALSLSHAAPTTYTAAPDGSAPPHGVPPEGCLWTLWPDPVPDKVTIPLHIGIAALVCIKGEVVNMAEVSKDPRWSSHLDQRTAYRTSSLLAVPLYKPASSEIVGMLQATNKSNGSSFTDDDRDALLMFASHVSLAVAAAQTRAIYDHLRRSLDSAGVTNLKDLAPLLSARPSATAQGSLPVPPPASLRSSAFSRRDATRHSLVSSPASPPSFSHPVPSSLSPSSPPSHSRSSSPPPSRTPVDHSPPLTSAACTTAPPSTRTDQPSAPTSPFLPSLSLSSS